MGQHLTEKQREAIVKQALTRQPSVSLREVAAINNVSKTRKVFSK